MTLTYYVVSKGRPMGQAKDRELLATGTTIGVSGVLAMAVSL